jgi:hypothetical protein
MVYFQEYVVDKMNGTNLSEINSRLSGIPVRQNNDIHIPGINGK